MKDETKMFLLFAGVVIAIILFGKVMQGDCPTEKFIVCVGNKDSVTIPMCYDFDLSLYKYEYQFGHGTGMIEHLIVTSKTNAHDVVSFPYKNVISSVKNCEE